MVRKPSADYLSDRDLWNDFKSGNSAAFTHLFESYVELLFDYGRNLCSDLQLIEDCIQDTFAELWTKKERLGDTSCIKYYLFKCLRRKVYIKLKKKQSKVFISLETNRNLFIQTQRTQELLMIGRESEAMIKTALQKAINTLPFRQKEAIYLRFYQENSFQEVSTKMGISMKSTYRIVSQAVEGLRICRKGLSQWLI